MCVEPLISNDHLFFFTANIAILWKSGPKVIAMSLGFIKLPVSVRLSVDLKIETRT